MFYRSSIAILLAISSSSAFSQPVPSIKLCSSAVKASAVFTTAAIELNKKQIEENKITPEAFEKKHSELQDFKLRNTIEACMQGEDPEVYICLSASTGDLTRCRN